MVAASTGVQPYRRSETNVCFSIRIVETVLCFRVYSDDVQEVMDDSTRQLVDSFRTDDDGIFSLTRSDTTRFSLISLCSNKRYCRRQSDVEHGFLIILLSCKHLLVIQA